MEHSKQLFDVVQKALNVAIERACGPEYIELTRWCLKVQRPAAALKSCDMISSASQRIYSHHMAKASKSRKGSVEEVTLDKDSDNVGNICDVTTVKAQAKQATMTVTTCSEYGFISVRNYDSVQAVGLEIIRQLPEEAMSTSIAHAYITPDDDTKIRIITRPHMEWHLNNDRMICKVCGNFFSRFAGGLRTHQVQEHKMNNDSVRDVMFVNSWQLVVYKEPLARSTSLLPTVTIEADALCSTSSSTTVNIDESEVEDSKCSTKSIKVTWLEYAKSSNLGAIKSYRQRQLDLKSLLQEKWENFDPFSSALDRDGNSLLTWAAGNGNFELCKYLVDECDMDPSYAFVGRRGRTRGKRMKKRVREEGIDVV